MAFSAELENLQKSVIAIYMYCCDKLMDKSVIDEILKLDTTLCRLSKYGKETLCFNYEKEHIQSICEAFDSFKDDPKLIQLFQSKLYIYDYFTKLKCILSSIKISLPVCSGFEQ